MLLYSLAADMLSLTCTWEKGSEHKQDVLEKPFNRGKNASLASWPHRGVCFKASVCALKVQLKSTAGVLLELRLISESRMSIHSDVPLSSITSNTNEAFAPLPPSLCPFPLHPPSLPTPSPLIVAVLARGLSVGVADELMQQVPSVERIGWRTMSDKDTGSERENETWMEVWRGRWTVMHWMSHRLVLLITSSLSGTNLSCPLCHQEREEIF